MGQEIGDRTVIRELKNEMEKGILSRREFIRLSTLLGLSAFSAYQMAGLVWPSRALAAKPKRGGTLRAAASVQKVTHPAQFSWIMPSNQFRQVCEYLTLTDGDNITHPYLLKNWDASDDLRTWTLNLREEIRFNNGDPFTADDVVFTFNQWLNKDVGSSLLGMLGDYLDLTGIEKVSDTKIVLHLKKPEIAVPEHLFHYPAVILNHRTFEGDLVKRPHGTGPYTLVDYREGERAVLKRRPDYWQKGPGGESLPYLDSMEFIDMGTEMAPQIAALQSGDIHMMDLGDASGTDVYKALKNDPNVQIQGATTAGARVLRMRVDMKPWDDNRVRMALKLCQHREKILALSYFGEGLEGHDFHVYPKHPEYCPKDVPSYDPAKAKQLLKEAGYPGGIKVTLAVGSGWSDIVRYAEILKQDAAPAGIDINIQTMPTSQYWEKWTEVDLGITPWTHRPLGTMVLNLAYVGDSEGNPVAWNETRWIDKEFSSLLNQANGTLDVQQRRKLFCKLEEIQMSRGPVGIPYWRNVWMANRKTLMNVKPHPNSYMLFNEVWLEG
jgi:peptide/nickel transport system substrate-binding protein